MWFAMSEYNEEIHKAKKAQRRFYVISIVVTVMLSIVVLLISSIWVISIEISPDDAKRSKVISLREGLGFVGADKVYLFSDEAKVSVVSPGFYVAHRDISSELGMTLFVKLKPLPGKIISATAKEAPNTNWFLDGELKSISKELSIEVEAGEHELVVDNPFYEQKTRKLHLNRGETKQVKLDLTPVLGRLAVNSKPVGANIYIDGEDAGQTPATHDLSGGAYKIELHLPGFEPLIDNVQITNRKPNVSRDYNLEIEKGFVRINADPLGGVLLLNGRKVSANKVLAFTAFKKNSLRYEKKGYYSKSVEFVVEPKEEKELVIRLKPQSGLVRVISSPNANAWVNGISVGMTPLEIKLPALKQEIKVSLTGYKSKHTTVVPSSSEVKTVALTLQSEKEFAVSHSKLRFLHKAGIKLKLFNPSSLTMGSPRYEKGQMANEFQRKITLNRAFYVSLHEVTNAQYSKSKKGAVSNNSPLVNISWNEAAIFCNWLSETAGVKKPFYRFKAGRYVGFDPSSTGYRLLSEAEWEWLARKSGKSEQTVFTWGNRPVIPSGLANLSGGITGSGISQEAASYDDGFLTVAPVGSFKANRDGLFDLDGNVREWVHDFYSLVPPSNENSIEFNPLGDKLGYSHVVKGAGWRSGNLTNMRASYRDSASKGRDDVGFRVARYLY